MNMAEISMLCNLTCSVITKVSPGQLVSHLAAMVVINLRLNKDLEVAYSVFKNNDTNVRNSP